MQKTVFYCGIILVSIILYQQGPSNESVVPRIISFAETGGGEQKIPKPTKRVTNIYQDWIRGHDFFGVIRDRVMIFLGNSQRGHDFFRGNSRQGHHFFWGNSRQGYDFFGVIRDRVMIFLGVTHDGVMTSSGVIRDIS